MVCSSVIFSVLCSIVIFVAFFSVAVFIALRGVLCSSATSGDALTLSCLGSETICGIFFAGKLGRALPVRKAHAVKIEQQQCHEDSLRAFALGWHTFHVAGVSSTFFPCRMCWRT